MAEPPAVLLMGGGEGMGPVKKTARALGESLYDASQGKPIGQLVIICGRNQTLRSTLKSVQWKVPVKIRGFERQMENWMGACDCIITKEVGNVLENGAGVFCKSLKETAKLVSRWFGPGSTELKKMSKCALKLAQPEAVFDIVKDIHELAQEQGAMSGISYTLSSSFTYGV